MKNFKNYAMALVALVIAATSVTLMSFNKYQKLTNQTFGMHVENRGQSNETRTWVPLDGLTEDLDYECQPSSNICKGEFAPEQIDPSTNLPYNDEVPEATSDGNFELTP